MPKISFEITAEDRDLSAALTRMQKEVARLEEANRRLAQQSKVAGKDARDNATAQSELMGTVVSRVSAAVVAYTSMSAAIKVINSDLEIMKRLQRETSQTQLGTAAAEREAIINMGAVSPAQRDAVLAQINRVASQRGISRQDALRGFGAGVGFSGQAGPTLAALDVAAQFNPYDVAAMTPGLLATSNVTRSDDPKANLGFLVGVQQTSPIKSTSLLTENLIPAAAGVRLQGDTDVEAAALVNALSFALTDPTGQQSGTAAQRLAAVLGKQFPGMGSTRARIEYLQKNPAAAKRAAAGIEQGATKAALVSLISDPNSQASQAFRESLASIPSAGQRVSVAEAAIANAGGTSVQRLGSLDRSLAARTEDMQFGGEADLIATEGTIGERLDKLENAMGVPTVGRWQRWAFDVGGALTGRPVLERQLVQAEFLRRIASEIGRKDTESELRQVVMEIRQVWLDSLGRAVRQNATNDLNTHTEGR